MKKYGRNILLLMAVALTSLASCVNDGLTEGPAAGAGKVAALDEQAASIEATVEDLNALQSAAEGYETALDEAVNALETHIADLRSGASLMEGTMATFAMQKKIAGVIGAIEVSDEEGAFKRQISNLEKGISAWVGKNFDAYYPAAKAEAVAAARLAGLDLKTQKIRVEAILSDVEAGLRKIADKDELTGLAAAVNGNTESAEELVASLSATAAEVEEEYAQAVETAVTDPEKFDLPALKQFNSAVASTLAEADNTLAGLIARVEACEAQLADIKERLESLESKVEDLEELLGMIQSVTFMSEYSAENAIAYYNLGTEYRADGKKVRTPAASIDLNYIVRPATAAKALEASDLWDSQMKVFGYYAGRIEQSAVSMFDFDITEVEADETTGIVTVTVSSSVLDEGFYFKETGAKLALSIATGKTDLTSKFVEIVPKDASSTVYIESLSLSDDYIEVDSELTAQLKAVLTPDDVTNSTLIWTTSDASIATVSGEGLVTAKVVGEATITVTTQGTDEWGQTLSRTCRVKVMPNIKLEAASYVEVGGTITINVKSPNYIDPQLVKWTSSNSYYATVDDDGVVTGAVSTYNASDKVYDNITITCTIGDYMPTVLTHTMPVVMAQPKGVRFASLDDGVEQKTIKIAEEFSLAGTIIPETAASNFRLFYQAAGGGNDAVATINNQTGAVTAKSPGSVTFMARVLENDQKYYYPRGTEVWRWVTVNVEPYWVETITLPATLEMAPEASATLTPEFTSDAVGVLPNYRTVTWTSSDPTIVSVNENTGELTALAEGTVYITATTNNIWSVPEGSDQKSATCVVTVKAQTVPINIGDYYYSDGTWSTELVANKTVIGVIFSTVNAVASDPLLMRDYPNCYNGLVISTVEYSEQDFGDVYAFSGHNKYVNLGYDATAIVNTDKPNGYGNTLAHSAFNASESSSCMFFNSTNGVVKTHTDKTATPSTASAWYIPSYKEMQLIKENVSVVNASINAAGGDPIADPYEGESSSDANRMSDWYWSSTIYGSWYATSQTYDHFKYPFDISRNGWTAALQSSGKFRVRVILAF